MRVFLVCVAVALLSSPAELRPRRRRPTVADIFNNAGIPETLNITAPEALLEACYENAVISLGNEISPEDTVGELEITFAAEADTLYTVVLLSPDQPTAEDPYWKSYLLGLWVNVGIDDSCNLDLSTGCEIALLTPASPVAGTGEHTYILLLFTQRDEIDTSNEDLQALNINRFAFNLAEFAETYCLTGPVAGNFFSASYPVQEEEENEEED